MAQISLLVNAKLISTFVFATRIVQSLYFCVCVGPGQKPHRWFSYDAAQYCI